MQKTSEAPRRVLALLAAVALAAGPGCVSAQGAPPFAVTTTPYAITLPSAMTWYPLATAGQCRVKCTVANNSVGTLYVCPFVATGTPTMSQIDQCANSTIHRGEKLPIVGSNNAWSIASDSISDCPIAGGGACNSSASMDVEN